MLDFLKTIITQAGHISLDFRSRLSSLNTAHKSPKDIVTEADVAVENFLVAQIKQAYPDHAILAEESGSHSGSGYRWIIDPIDGTTSFLHDQPFYSISVALEKDDELILGAVNAPALGELFLAEKGKGSTCNDKPIRVSQRERLIDSVLGTGFACVRNDLTRNNLPYFAAILPEIRGIRRYGSAAIDLCYVACGRMDGFWELNLKLYDMAAGGLILQEAGGTVTDFSGKRERLPDEVVGSNGLIHQNLLDLLTSVDQPQI